MKHSNSHSVYSHKNMLRKLFLTACSIALIVCISVAQTPEYTRVTLKSGASIVGKVLELDPEKSVKIELAGGNVVEIAMSNVLEISPVGTESEIKAVEAKHAKPEYEWKKKGYYLSGNLGFPFGVDSWGDPTLNISLMIAGGYTFNEKFSVGLATGTDLYWWPNSMVHPVALELKARLSNKSFSPYITFQGGYGFLGSTQIWSEENSGGLYLAPSVGITSKYRPNVAWYFQMGFRTQSIKGAYEDGFWSGTEWVQSVVEEKVTYNRFDLRFGFLFE